MQNIKVNNDSLTIVNLGEIQIAFSYKKPIAINHESFTFITDRFYSKTTSKHCYKIADIWNVNRNKCGIGGETFRHLLKAIKQDIGRDINNRMAYIEQLQELPLD